MKRIAFGLLMLSQSVLAQVGSATFDMPWKAVFTGSLVPVKTSSTGVVSVISGQAQPLALPLSATPTVINVTFPGQTSTPMVISGFRITGTAKAGDWSTSISPTKMLSSPITVPTGRPLVVQITYSLASGSGSFSWAPDLQTLTGTITPPPVPVPAPTPSPTPTQTANVPGDSVPPLGQLVDKSGGVWMLQGTTVLLNGKDIGVSNFQTDTNQLLMSVNNVVRAISPVHGYICYLNGAWTGTGC